MKGNTKTMKKSIKLVVLSLLSLAAVSCGQKEESVSSTPIFSDGSDPISDSSEITKPSESTESESVTETTYSVSDAIDLATLAGDEGATAYAVKATIKSITNYYYGQMYLTDGTNELYVYGARGADGVQYFDKLDYVPQVGDTIVIKGVLQTYKGEPQMKVGSILSVEKTHEIKSDEGYTAKTIAEARKAEVGEKIKVTGVVSAITRTQKMNYSGFYLIDSTGSIYIYGAATTSQVKEGNTVTIIGEMDHFISSSETALAEKNGYTGSIQLSNTYLIANDDQVNDFDKSWIEETTIKDIIETDVAEKNITTNVYHVKAIIKKKEVNVLNYYINDLDGETGSYVYSSNSCAEYTYLDNYLDQVVDLYVSPINCKSTASGCIYRFIPVAVSTIDNYTYDLSKACQFALDYVADKQFNTTYAGDPNKELVTNYSNDILGISNVKLSYVSSNTALAYFEEKDDKTYFHVNDVENSSATITITATLNEYVATSTIDVTYNNVLKDTKTVKEAIDSEADTVIKIHGVVAGKTINKSGFYVIDETGAIAIQLSNSDDLNKVSIGDEVVVSGTRNYTGTDKGGQINLNSASLLGVVSTGNNYSTASFKESTIDELACLGMTENATAQVYTVSAYCVQSEGNYPQLYFYASEESYKAAGYKLQVYCSNTTQYDYCTPYIGKQVTLEVALVNWNNKTFYRCCPISISDGTTTAHNPIH